jgi:hypothetical protein
MHRISGPHRGYYVAAYTAEARGGFVGYGQACITRPSSAWRAQRTADASSSVYPNELQALVAAEHKVRLDIEQMPPSWAPFTEPGALSADSR